MAGVRGFTEVTSYPVDDEFYADDSGYVLEAKQDGTGEVEHVEGDSESVIGVNYVSTEDQWEDVVNPDSGEVDVVPNSGGFPVKADEGEYRPQESVYLSNTNDGHVNTTDTENYRLGTVVRPENVDEDGEKVIVKFTTV